MPGGRRCVLPWTPLGGAGVVTKSPGLPARMCLGVGSSVHDPQRLWEKVWMVGEKSVVTPVSHQDWLRKDLQ